MAQQVANYANPVLAALKRLGGSARPAEVCAAVAKDMGMEGSRESSVRGSPDSSTVGWKR